MTVRIGHASIDENGKAAGGKAGDQTGKEVKISNWYNGNWGFVARAKNPEVSEAIAVSAEDGCNNQNIGYDQSGRNTLMIEARKVNFELGKIANVCECDCSSFASVCVRAALGRDYYKGNAPTTSTLKKVLEGTGAFEILTDKKYLNSEKHLLRGDILNSPGKHVVVVLDDGSSKKVPNAPKPEIVPIYYSVRLPVLNNGSMGDNVRALQILLIGNGYSCGKAGIDGDFGSGTENALMCFQEDNGLEVDAKCGPKTWAKILGS